MRKLMALIFLVVVLLAANLLAQRLFPTARTDSLERRIGHYLVVVGIVGVFWLCTAGVAILLGL